MYITICKQSVTVKPVLKVSGSHTTDVDFWLVLPGLITGYVWCSFAKPKGVDSRCVYIAV